MSAQIGGDKLLGRKKTRCARGPNCFVTGLAGFLFTALSIAGSASWAGRPLVEILAELQAQGLALIYSNQVVTPDLRVRNEPVATKPIDRLQEVLKPLG